MFIGVKLLSLIAISVNHYIVVLLTSFVYNDLVLLMYTVYYKLLCNIGESFTTIVLMLLSLHVPSVI